MTIRLLFIPVILLLAILWLYFLTTIAPSVQLTDDEVGLKFPTNFNDLVSLVALMKIYYDQNWIYVVTLFCSAYLFKQAFVIPGSALLNILGGALFGITVALPLCCFLTCVGATCSYLISKFFCKELIKRKWPGNVNYLQIKVNENKNRLLYFLLFLRLFPMTPNWLINLVSPIVGIPLHLFTISVFIGLIPYNFLCVQAGSMLSSFSSLDDIFTYKTFMQLFIMALVALGPTLFLKGRVK